MDIQEKQALIAEIERFKEEAMKMHIVKVLADSYTNTNLFDHIILEDEGNKVWWMKTQAYELWCFWQAAKAVPEGFVLAERKRLADAVDGIEKLFKGDNLLALGELLPIQQDLNAMLEAQGPTND